MNNICTTTEVNNFQPMRVELQHILTVPQGNDLMLVSKKHDDYHDENSYDLIITVIVNVLVGTHCYDNIEKKRIREEEKKKKK
ncbi:hypothetical protein PoB_004965600 [Plakobranchus ocellatus]|uniref:Uncharacterized protein n=1 Tax=Plakobranchus ocellatus TaxID=259542 RepID=A0AAV4BRN7_9GAST|nr:hypothetical protein PoB_004965600 [Plakobranchus ocellatus]